MLPCPVLIWGERLSFAATWNAMFVGKCGRLAIFWKEAGVDGVGTERRWGQGLGEEREGKPTSKCKTNKQQAHKQINKIEQVVKEYPLDLRSKQFKNSEEVNEIYQMHSVLPQGYGDSIGLMTLGDFLTCWTSFKQGRESSIFTVSLSHHSDWDWLYLMQLPLNISWSCNSLTRLQFDQDGPCWFYFALS